MKTDIRDEKAIADQPHGGLINVFTADAAIREDGEDERGLIPAAYRGLDRYAARKKIVFDLEAQALLEKIEPHKLVVPRGDRSGSVVEPFLTDQWYVKIQPLAAPAIRAVEQGDIRFVPDNWKNTYFEWMRNIQDWCISRQIWWGHRIPAWYDADGNVSMVRVDGEIVATYTYTDGHLTQRTDAAGGGSHCESRPLGRRSPRKRVQPMPFDRRRTHPAAWSERFRFPPGPIVR